MQDAPGPTDTVELAEDGSAPAMEPGAEAVTSTTDTDGGPTTALVEVLPGVAVVFGQVPDALKVGLVDFGVVPEADRTQVATTLASLVGSTAAVGGNLANAMNSARGLYRLADATQALVNSGAVLAVKDGANLGSVWLNGDLVAQARFIPVNAVSVAAAVAAVGPAVAMIAIQMQLNQISELIKTNIALTTEVLATVRKEQWAELAGHVSTLDKALARAQEIGSVPASLWDTVSGSEADLVKQRDLYRRNVNDHCVELDRLSGRARREYLDRNAEAIVFDSHALVSSLKAWTTYQALHAGKARTAGAHDPDEARLVDIIARDTRMEFEPALAETTRLVDSLTRELHLIADLPGRSTIPLSKRRRDSEASRHTSADLLKAIEPLADALRTPREPLQRPEIVCAPEDVDLDPYLRSLGWFLESDETLRGLAFCRERDDDFVRSVGQTALNRIGPEKWATVVAVTDRRILVSRAEALRQDGDLGRVIPLDDVRYVRTRTGQAASARPEIDLITRDIDLKWSFRTTADAARTDALAALFAESMTLPDHERLELAQRAHARIEAPEHGEAEAAEGPPELTP